MCRVWPGILDFGPIKDRNLQSCVKPSVETAVFLDVLQETINPVSPDLLHVGRERQDWLKQIRMTPNDLQSPVLIWE